MTLNLESDNLAFPSLAKEIEDPGQTSSHDRSISHLKSVNCYCAS